ncbi:MAG TPA: cytochrome c biogenesis protein ResB [Blastocatellia bacterium]|nr:cytochrome c biogenesis protein ResB [Blastocatellia bacterium]
MATTKTHLPTPRTEPVTQPTARASIIDKSLRLLSSVRFGIIMLMLLLACCMIGMIIMQQNVEGFRTYYARLTPATRSLYEALGFFNIYHSWYFTTLLAITGLNIILASVDRFPAAWAYVSKPKRVATPRFVAAQAFTETASQPGEAGTVAERVAAAWRKSGLRAQVNQADGRLTVFAERGLWNRFGAYVVHVALLLIFIGGFLTSRYGVGGQLELVPGKAGNSFTVFDASAVSDEPTKRAQMPFTVECTDLQQSLIRPEGNLDVMNTIDWLSFVKITDNGKETAALVHLNAPVDYRGYRFFQSSFVPTGYARQVTLTFTPPSGGAAREVTIQRNGSADVEGVGRVSYEDFYPDFTVESGQPDTASGDYNNPAVKLRVARADGKTEVAIAQTAQARAASADKADVLTAATDELAMVAGHRVTLKSFEKVSQAHTLTVQYDPGRMPVYLGFGLLTLSLCMVFFYSHQRVWAVVEPDGKHTQIYFGGNTNRNRPAFEARFNSLVRAVVGGNAK